MKNDSCYKFRFLIPLAVIGFLALLGFAVYGLWNHVLAEVVGVKVITYWQALGLLILAKILFGGFPGRGGCGGPPWRRRMMEKRWGKLNPEQREHMREEMRHRFGDWPHPPWCDDDSSKSDEPGKGKAPDRDPGHQS